MTRKPVTTLASAMARKTVTAPATVESSGAGTRTLTLRLQPSVHDRLREMSYTSRRSQHSLLLEALNLLFERHGKRNIAS